MNLRKSRVSLALTAALAGVAAPAMVSAQNVSDDGTGNVLIFPYYTANDGWTTLFNITNVSDSFQAVKVRFREQENSRDVLDFNVVMSPEDVWTAWVATGANGIPTLYTKDKSCTSPILPVNGDGAAYAAMQDVAYTGSSSDGGSTGIDRAAEGHLEVYVMGSQDDEDAQMKEVDGSPVYPTAYWADHAHMDCSIVDANFKVDSGGNTGNGQAVEPSEDDNATNTNQDSLAGNPKARYDFDRPDSNPLKGNISFINTNRGVGAGSTALPIKYWGRDIDDEGVVDGNGQRGLIDNLVTAQEFPYFLEPTLASNAGLWVLDLDEDLDSYKVMNEWSVNANTGARTDWIIAFPDKYLHVDIFDDIQAGVNLVRLAALADMYAQDWGAPCESVVGGYTCDGGDTESTLAGALASGGALESVLRPFSEPFDGQSCDEVTFDLWDREENGVRGSGTSISPAPPVPASSLCYESNVITFGGAESVLNSRLAQTIDTSGLTSGASAGWMNLQFGAEGGLPVAGFALKERDFGDPNKNYGQLMDHAYERSDDD